MTIITSLLIFGAGFFVGGVIMSAACASKRADESTYAVPLGYSEEYVRGLQQQLTEAETTVSTLRSAYQSLTKQHQEMYESTRQTSNQDS